MFARVISCGLLGRVIAIEVNYPTVRFRYSRVSFVGRFLNRLETLESGIGARGILRAL